MFVGYSFIVGSLGNIIIPHKFTNSNSKGNWIFDDRCGGTKMGASELAPRFVSLSYLRNLLINHNIALMLKEW